MSITLDMSLKKGVRNLIIGRGAHIDSYSEYKRVMLSGHLALICILLCSAYALFDIVLNNFANIPILGAAIIILAMSIFVHRQGDHAMANYLLLPTCNITLYLIAASESPNSGAFIFFIVNSIAAFAVFSYKQRLISTLFAVFTYVLFVMAYFVDFSFLPMRNYNEETLIFFVVLNFSAALPTALMAVHLLIRLNHHSALQLIENTDLLMKTNAELDRFVYSTSHDLRAPLTSVMGLINITERSDKPEDVSKYLGMMRDRVHSLDRFIRDITDYSRNNRLEIAKEKVSLHSLGSEIWDNLRFSPEAEHINFEMDIPEDFIIEADKNRLQVVIGNLVSNAVRYHDPRKHSQFIKLQYQLSDRVLSLKVADNGQGIPKEYHTKIFDMFFRANEKSKGSGLGLYIVKEAMMKLSGSIQLDSTPGVGTTFTLRLPY